MTVERLAAWSRVASIALVAVGLGCGVALHLLRPELGPVEHRISEYTLGPHAWLMTAAFVSTGAGILALAWPLARVGGPWTRAVPALLTAAGTGMVIAGIFPTDRVRSGATADAVHSRASALATIALIAAALAWSVLRTRRRSTDAVLAMLALLLGAVSPLLHRSTISGGSQRLLWLTLLAWLIVTACRLTLRGRQDVSEPSATHVAIGTQ